MRRTLRGISAMDPYSLDEPDNELDDENTYAFGRDPRIDPLGARRAEAIGSDVAEVMFGASGGVTITTPAGKKRTLTAKKCQRRISRLGQKLQRVQQAMGQGRQGAEKRLAVLQRKLANTQRACQSAGFGALDHVDDRLDDIEDDLDLLEVGL